MVVADSNTKNDLYPLGRILTWFGNRGGALYKVYATVEYTKLIS